MQQLLAQQQLLALQQLLAQQQLLVLPQYGTVRVWLKKLHGFTAQPVKLLVPVLDPQCFGFCRARRVEVVAALCRNLETVPDRGDDWGLPSMGWGRGRSHLHDPPRPLEMFTVGRSFLCSLNDSSRYRYMTCRAEIGVRTTGRSPERLSVEGRSRSSTPFEQEPINSETGERSRRIGWD